MTQLIQVRCSAQILKFKAGMSDRCIANAECSDHSADDLNRLHGVLDQNFRIITRILKTNYRGGAWSSYKLYDIISTLTAIVFLHYRVAFEMAIEILGYTMCRVRL